MNQVQSTKQQVKGPRSLFPLGPVCYEKKALSQTSRDVFATNTNVTCRKLARNSQTCEKQNKENKRQRKIITCTRQYLHGLIICLHSRNCRDFTIIRGKKIQSATVQFLYPAHRIHNGSQNGPNFFF